jgi:hypothetical protein
MTISEELIEIAREGAEHIPCSLWSATDRPRQVVLMGHGLGVDRYHQSIQLPMQVLARECDAIVIAPDIPLHGVRNRFPDDPMGIVQRWQTYWASGGVEETCSEFLRLEQYCRREFGPLPISYFGLSLGTQYGVVFLARAERVSAAVLGLFGSHPPPQTPVMNRFAPRVSCPVYFVQKLDDEIHPAETTTHLFSMLGAAEKFMDTTRGSHVAVSEETFRNACAFLDEQATRRT